MNRIDSFIDQQVSRPAVAPEAAGASAEPGELGESSAAVPRLLSPLPPPKLSLATSRTCYACVEDMHAACTGWDITVIDGQIVKQPCDCDTCEIMVYLDVLYHVHEWSQRVKRMPQIG